MDESSNIFKNVRGINKKLRELLGRSGKTNEDSEMIKALIAQKKLEVLHRLDKINVQLHEGDRANLAGAAKRNNPEDISQAMIGQLVRSYPLIAKIAQFKDLTTVLKVAVLSPYSLVYERGSLGDDLLFIVKGKLKTFIYNILEEEITIDYPRSGDIVGITALISGKRGEFCIALNHCTLVSLPFSLLKTMIEENPEIKTMVSDAFRKSLIAERLRSTGLFGSIPPERFNTFLTMSTLRFYKTAEIIIKEQSKTPPALQVIGRGRVDVYKVIEGESILLNRLYPGEFFGEMSILSGSLPTATIRASSATEIIILNQSTVASMIKQYPEIEKRLQSVKEERSTMNRQAVLQKSRKLPPTETPRVQGGEQRLLPPPKIDESEKNELLKHLNVEHLLNMAERENILGDEDRRRIVEKSKAAQRSTNKQGFELTLEDFSDFSLEDILENTYIRAKQEIEKDIKELKDNEDAASLQEFPSIFGFIDRNKK